MRITSAHASKKGCNAISIGQHVSIVRSDNIAVQRFKALGELLEINLLPNIIGD